MKAQTLAHWNLADMFDAVARTVPADRAAIVQGNRTVTWGELDARSNRLARALMAAGHQPGERVGFLSRNHPGYIEGFIACLKARLIHVNLNYRYTLDEIAGVMEDAGATAIFYHQESGRHIAPLRARMPALRTRICLSGAHADASASLDDWADTGDASPLDIVRSDDDPLLLYTGGTTGRPKGVIWPGNRYRACQLESPLVQRRPANLAEHLDIVVAQNGAGRVVPACPLMHGAGISSTLSELLGGGTALLLQGSSFDPEELWQLAQDGGASRILIVGDVFARPMLRALDAQPDKYRLDGVKVISSAGLMWSEEIKKGLLRHMPWLLLADIYGASEASGLGYTVSTLGNVMPTGRFHPGPQTVVIGEDGHLVAPGVAAEGWLARGEPLPLGYHGDAKKTAEVFRIIDGARYAMPGDWVRRNADGTMQLLGRGSLVINTGGEKVFVEEVEEALKQLPAVADALVVGLPDERWGSTVAALVTLHGPGQPDLPRWREAMAGTLAAYKMPRHVWRVDRLPRADSGKGDYRAARTMAAALLETTDPTGSAHV
ncbi:MAG: AMP-binding protein [Burkholderiaceae bacterium]